MKFLYDSNLFFGENVSKAEIRVLASKIFTTPNSANISLNKIEQVMAANSTRNRVNIEPPIIFRMAVQKLSYKIILAHNHPSGILTPSKADLDFTDKIYKVGSILEIDVLDHLIITETDYHSFESEGILDRIKESGMYEVLNRDKVGIIEWKLELEKKQAKKDNSIAIARKLKKEGMDEKFIKKMTGLYLDEIRKL